MIHQYKNNGYNIVIDVASGSIHAVDEVSYSIIALYQTHTKAQIITQILAEYQDQPNITEQVINDVLSEIELLKQQGQLFSQDIYAPVAADFKNRQSVVKALCLHMAHDCNLRCRYCFADEGEYKTTNRDLMPFSVGKKALDYLIKNSGSRQNLEVDFFGGEPLLNFAVIKDLVAYARKQEKIYHKNFRFTLTTNGLLLDDEVMYFVQKEMSNIVLSLDGRKMVHDRFRVSKNGQGSYDLVLPKFLKMAEMLQQKNYYIRGTYTKYNTDFTTDILHLADLGFKQLSLEPVVAPSDADYALTEADLPQLYKEYDRLAAEMAKRHQTEREFTFYHYMIDLMGGPCIVKRISGCGVGTEYLAVTATGDLYPCHQFVGIPQFLLGNLDTGIVNHKIREQFSACNVYSHKECQDCFARLFCSGGCAANAFNATGDITGIYELGCKLHKKRIECAIMLQVAQNIN
ncbi:MAG: thioether cross-link-forming SCIFF peptide maturase [Bacillota bacterium]|jgi:uncharacterized protein